MPRSEAGAGLKEEHWEGVKVSRDKTGLVKINNPMP